MNLFTIGFTKKPAQRFFELLRGSGARRVVDVRLNNVSQLAGFAKKDDLAYFLKEVAGIDYVHLPELAPTQSMLDHYKKQHGSWNAYEAQFLDLMQHRRVELTIPRQVLADGCLLCSEDQPHHCHRRLVAEYLKQHWGDVDVAHLTEEPHQARTRWRCTSAKLNSDELLITVFDATRLRMELDKIRLWRGDDVEE